MEPHTHEPASRSRSERAVEVKGEPEGEAADRAVLGAIEAILLCAPKAATTARIAQAVGLSGDDAGLRIEALIGRLNAECESTGRAYGVERIAGGWRIMTRPEHADAVAAFLNLGGSGRLSRAAVETLSIIAYRQPVTRAELESIRGVACGEVLRSLLERRLVEITGRAEEVGRPMLYGTTHAFLEHFGLPSIKDLPPLAHEPTLPGGGAEPDPGA